MIKKKKLFYFCSKLEHGLYTTPLEVFNDIYLVWLSAYRTHPPGSPLWIQAHEASKTFLQQIANEPIRDDFTPPGSLVTPGGSTYGNEDNYNPGRPSTGASPRKTNDFRLFLMRNGTENAIVGISVFIYVFSQLMLLHE